MPSATFYNLPEEKRRKLLGAALEEFARVPFPQASINRIIQSAGIPRGSFYMYFTDKEELFRHLLETYQDRLTRLLCRTLDGCGGDLFAAAEALRALLAGQGEGGPDGAGESDASRLGAVLRCNAALPPSQLTGFFCRRELLDQLRAHIDVTRLSLEGEGDLADIIHILTGVTVSSLAAQAAGVPGPELTRRYRQTLDLLRRGMAAPRPTSL